MQVSNIFLWAELVEEHLVLDYGIYFLFKVSLLWILGGTLVFLTEKTMVLTFMGACPAGPKKKSISSLIGSRTYSILILDIPPPIYGKGSLPLTPQLPVSLAPPSHQALPPLPYPYSCRYLLPTTPPICVVR